MSSDGVNEYWRNRKADIFDKSAYSSGRVEAIKKLAEMARYRLRLSDTSSLELGCGSGLFSKVSGIRSITGIDYSETLLDIARQRMDDVRLQSIFEMKLPEKSIDNIISLFVIDDYTADVKGKFFADIFALLKPGGHLFFAAYTPNDEGMKQFCKLAGYEVYVESAAFYKTLLTRLGFCVEVFDILNAQGELKVDGAIQPIRREYVLIDAVKNGKFINL